MVWVHHSLLWLNLLIGLLGDLVYVGFIKASAARARPGYNKDDMFLTVSVDRYSFPSGHSTRVAYLAMFFIHYGASGPMMFLWAVCVGLSRIVLGKQRRRRRKNK